MHDNGLTEKDLSMDEKNILGKIIDLWGAGDAKDPYGKSTEASLIGRAENDGISQELVLEVLKSLEEKGLILRDEENGRDSHQVSGGGGANRQGAAEDRLCLWHNGVQASCSLIGKFNPQLIGAGLGSTSNRSSSLPAR